MIPSATDSASRVGVEPQDPHLPGRWSRASFAWLGAGVFLVVGIVRSWRHEPWRDECNILQLAMDNHSFGELMFYLRYECHPFLWGVFAWCLAQFTTHLFALALVHAVVASAAAYVLLRYSPWPRWEALLCLLGYFTFFEYAVVCRAYVLALLGVLLVAAAWQKRVDRSMLCGAGLFLLTQSSPYGLLLAFALFPLLLLAAWDRRRSGGVAPAWLMGWLIPFAVGTALALVAMIPAADGDTDHPTNRPWAAKLNVDKAYRVAGTVWNSMIPIPKTDTPFTWNSNIADGLSSQSHAILGVIALVAAMFILRRDRTAMMFLLLAAGGVCALTYLKHFGSIRHHGHIFLAFLLAAWLASAKGGVASDRAADWLRRGVFVAQAVAGIWLATDDWMRPFTANRDAADWIAQRDYTDHLLVGHAAHASSGVGMHLNRPVYYLARQRFGTFIVRNNVRHDPASDSEAFARAAALGDQNGKPVLLISNINPPDQAGFRLMAAFTDSMISDERFYLYERPLTTRVSQAESSASQD